MIVPFSTGEWIAVVILIWIGWLARDRAGR